MLLCISVVSLAFMRKPPICELSDRQLHSKLSSSLFVTEPYSPYIFQTALIISQPDISSARYIGARNANLA